jgi:hypothetical protein
VQHLRDFGRFEMNKRNLGRQREDRTLVAEKEITWKFLSLQFGCEFKTSGRKTDGGILNLVRFS